MLTLESPARRRARLAVSFSIAAAAVAASLPALADDAQVETGFAIEASLTTRVYPIVAGTASTGGTPTPATTLPTLGAGMILGYKFGRFLIGLGLEFDNTSISESVTTAGVSTSANVSLSNFLLGPDFQVEMVRSADQRVSLIGDAALHLGHQFTSISTTPAPTTPAAPTDSNLLISYRIGVGPRFWAHRHFAFQAVTGFGGQANVGLPVNNDPQVNQSQHGIYASFGALGAF